MCTAVSKRQLVMHLLGWLIDAVLQALLTQWVLMNVAVTNALLCSAIPFLCFRIPAVAVVFPCVGTFVCRAVKLTVFGKVRAPGHAAGPPWFLGHGFISFGHKKSPTGLSP